MPRLFMLLGFFVMWEVGFGQIIVDLNHAKPQVKSRNYHDFDRTIKKVIPERQMSDSARYAHQLQRAYHFMLTDSLNVAEKAFQECLKILPLAPSNAIIRAHLGDIAQFQGRYPEALDYYTQVLKQLPNEYGTRLKRAEVYVKQGNAEAALTDCNVVAPFAQTDSLRARIHFVRGSAELMRQHYAPAIMEWQEVLRLEPNNVNVPILLAETTYLDGRPSEALRIIMAFLQKHPQDQDALLLQAELRAALRNKH